MSPLARLGVGTLIGTLYFQHPLLLENTRPPGLSANDLRAGLATLPPLLQPGAAQKAQLLAQLEAADRAWVMESSWGTRIGPLLSPELRKQAEDYAQLEPNLPRTSSKLDPELKALAQTLLDQGGDPQGSLPPPPETDPWGAYVSKNRVRGLLNMARAQKLPAELCTPVLVATLAAIQAQLQRIQAEEAATDLLSADQEQSIRGSQMLNIRKN